MVLYILRHGHSRYNDTLNCNDINTPLSALGIKQAQDLCPSIIKTLSKTKTVDSEITTTTTTITTTMGEKQPDDLVLIFDEIIISPLRRCRQTLKYSGIKCHETITFDDRYCEWNLGPCDDLHLQDIKDWEKEEQDTFVTRIEQLRPEIHRMMNSGRSYLIIGHFYVFKVLFGQQITEDSSLETKPSPQNYKSDSTLPFKLPNCSLRRVQQDNKVYSLHDISRDHDLPFLVKPTSS
jgi:broad specificity phosphatase PhoE